MLGTTQRFRSIGGPGRRTRLWCVFLSSEFCPASEIVGLAVNETSVIRWNYGDPQLGSCQQTIQGGNHFRYWVQNGPNANRFVQRGFQHFRRFCSYCDIAVPSSWQRRRSCLSDVRFRLLSFSAWMSAEINWQRGMISYQTGKLRLSRHASFSQRFRDRYNLGRYDHHTSIFLSA